MHFSKAMPYLIFRDIDVSRNQTPKSITELAEEVGLVSSEVLPYGSTKAKVDIKVLERLANKPRGKYVIVAGCVLLNFLR
jgi:methylenetetrahydrofolate dehydrogenase (NADP+) / methenyltetrahydrofolate cyclohydrolase / formyltetrahydrofolate synthetase